VTNDTTDDAVLPGSGEEDAVDTSKGGECYTDGNNPPHHPKWLLCEGL